MSEKFHRVLVRFGPAEENNTLVCVPSWNPGVYLVRPSSMFAYTPINGDGHAIAYVNIGQSDPDLIEFKDWEEAPELEEDF